MRPWLMIPRTSLSRASSHRPSTWTTPAKASTSTMSRTWRSGTTCAWLCRIVLALAARMPVCALGRCLDCAFGSVSLIIIIITHRDGDGWVTRGRRVVGIGLPFHTFDSLITMPCDYAHVAAICLFVIHAVGGLLVGCWWTAGLYACIHVCVYE